MQLSLPQRLCLLCHTVDEGTVELVNVQGRGQLLRAAALHELALAEHLSVEGEKVRRRGTGPTGDAFLAEVWHDLPADSPKSWLPFVHHKAATAAKPVREQLVAAGVITVERQKKLGVLPFDRVHVKDPRQVLDLQRGVRDAVLRNTGPAAVPADELTTAVFAAEVEVPSVFTAKDRREHRDTLTALAAYYDESMVPGLRKALRDAYLSSRAVGGGWGA
ncbi:GOLPH3/VPS74 family protein [Streptomyces cremeus]|uniref:GPP34 family phosphoprotein n=1 Tax=Streptomyces cremeus TaxID=66881 RepID=A0ABV5PI51_STRCM